MDLSLLLIGFLFLCCPSAHGGREPYLIDLCGLCKTPGSCLTCFEVKLVDFVVFKRRF